MSSREKEASRKAIAHGTKGPLYTWGDPSGLKRPGTVDLWRQPSVLDRDGRRRTVHSIGIGFDDGEYLLPMVTTDGRLLSTADEAVDEFRKTGLHLGVFESPDASTAYGKDLHLAYERGDIYPRETGPVPDPETE